MMPARVSFDSFLSIRESGEQYIDSAKSGVFDLRGLKDSNSAAVALLLAWFRYAHHLGKSIDFAGTPQSLRNLIEVMELDEILPLQDSL